jgi:glycosyltransferase involved in cell wall biosynthesis
MEPIRVLHMIGTLEIGGSQSFILNIYSNIDRNKLQFDFIVDHPDRMDYENDVKQLGARVYIMPKFNGKNIREIKKAWNRFFEDHPDYKVLHSHVRSYASIYLPIAKKHDVKTIIHSHSTSNGFGLLALVKSILQYPVRYQADYFMACSREAGEWLFGKKVCESNKFQVAKNAIDVKKYTFNERMRTEVRRELGLNDEFVLGYLARVVVPKNPFFIIDSMHEILKIKPTAKLLFVGDGDLLKSVKEKARIVGIDGSIIFTGARTDVERMLSAMDCYLLPSIWEGLGISLIEAQSSGLKCLCSENIPSAAIVTDLVQVIPLTEGSKNWAAKAVENDSDYKRENQYEKIKTAGYDIAENVEIMSSFYMKLFIK